MRLQRLKVQNLQGGPSGWRPREKSMLQFKSKCCLLAEFPFVQGGQSFVPSADWKRPTYIREGQSAYSKSADLNDFWWGGC